MTIGLDKTLEHDKIKKFMDLESIDLLRQLVHGDKVPWSITNLLTNFTYVCPFHEWANNLAIWYVETSL